MSKIKMIHIARAVIFLGVILMIMLCVVMMIGFVIVSIEEHGWDCIVLFGVPLGLLIFCSSLAYLVNPRRREDRIAKALKNMEER